MSDSINNRILDMAPDLYKEIDGVTFDADSFARHCVPEPAEVHEPIPAFIAPPVHVGWYPPTGNAAPIPQMGGAVLPPEPSECPMLSSEADNEIIVRRVCGSGSGSYLTSWRTSRIGSSYYGSGSGQMGGYGWELI